MKKEILHQNKSEIEYHQSAYRSAAKEIQAEIDKLIKAGIPLTDEAINLLVTSYNRFEDWLTDFIKAELDTLKFEFQKKAADKEMGEFYVISKKAHSIIQDSFNLTVTNQKLSFSNFVIKDTIVSLKDGLDDQIVDQFTIYLDSDPKREVLKMANDIIERVKTLEQYVKDHGNDVKGLGTDTTWSSTIHVLAMERYINGVRDVSNLSGCSRTTCSATR